MDISYSLLIGIQNFENYLESWYPCCDPLNIIAATATKMTLNHNKTQQNTNHVHPYGPYCNA